MIQEAVTEQYRARYKSFLESEKVGSLRTIFSIADKIIPAWSQATKSVFAYMRILDDIADESPYALVAQEVISRERRGILGFDKPTPLQEELLEKPFSDLFGGDDQKPRIYLDKILSGVMTDLNIRFTQQPLTESQLKARNFRVTYHVFAVLFMGAASKDPKPTPATVEAFNDLATYDNISDIFEDLPNGLVLLSKEDLEKHNLHFNDGGPLETERLLAFNVIKRKEVRGRLRHSSAELFRLGLPPWLSTLLYAYFYTRSLKLLIPLEKKQDLIY